MENNKVILVSFTNQKQLGFTFTKWPNHITLVPYFNVSNVQNLIKDLATATEDFSPFPYQVGQNAVFGGDQAVNVSMIVPSISLIRLHVDLLNVALKYDPGMDLKHCKQNYKPHITHNQQPLPSENDTGKVDGIYLVRKISPSTKDKVVLAKFVK